MHFKLGVSRNRYRITEKTANTEPQLLKPIRKPHLAQPHLLLAAHVSKKNSRTHRHQQLGCSPPATCSDLASLLRPRLPALLLLLDARNIHVGQCSQTRQSSQHVEHRPVLLIFDNFYLQKAALETKEVKNPHELKHRLPVNLLVMNSCPS
ncbi:hypothetical protein LXL04_031955 [Taraxacum kok-saghyz]